jgi:hypothetical protein
VDSAPSAGSLQFKSALPLSACGCAKASPSSSLRRSAALHASSSRCTRIANHHSPGGLLTSPAARPASLSSPRTLSDPRESAATRDVAHNIQHAKWHDRCTRPDRTAPSGLTARVRSWTDHQARFVAKGGLGNLRKVFAFLRIRRRSLQHARLCEADKRFGCMYPGSRLL